ncbi:MAG: LysM peptidoglycan-binding domain-containing protein [Bacteroidetes bacterium]|nr:LysM peptidoglycan-binding domain-containing protein [Bacteroidota bacterium]
MSKIIVLNGQSLFDIALQQYGTVDSVFRLAEENNIDNITDDLIPGTELIINENYKSKTFENEILKESNLKYVTVSSGQNLFDLSLQEYGSTEGVAQLAKDNGINSITDSINEGTQLIIDRNKIINANVVNDLKNKNAIVASRIKETQEVNSGIGYWAIGIDFIVS